MVMIYYRNKYNQNQPNKEMNGEESGRVPNAKILLPFPTESGYITLSASVCDNTHGILLIRETHPSFGV